MNAIHLRGQLRVASDKSLTHRAIMFASLAQGRSRIRNPLRGADNMATLRAFEAMGVRADSSANELLIDSPGAEQLQESPDVLDFANSGTTTRLMLGILAGLPLFSAITGDQYLRKRPMLRVVEPLRRMGARIDGRRGGDLLPLAIRGGGLHAIDYQSPIASAQVKSAVLLAGLFARGTTSVCEPQLSRDHTERLLPAFGVQVERHELCCALRGAQQLRPCDIEIPADISSAAFFLVAAACLPDSDVVLRDVGINPSRAGVIDVLQAMGAQISLLNQRSIGGEPLCDIRVQGSQLQATDIGGTLIPRLIDEIPALAVAMSLATGRSTVRDARELRVKETDRIKTTLANLRALDIQCDEFDDGFSVQGEPDRHFPAGVLQSAGDHRIGMSAFLFRLHNPAIRVEGMDAVDVSYPQFEPDLRSLIPADMQEEYV